MSTLCFSALLMECEQRGLLAKEVALLREIASAADGDSTSDGGMLGKVVANAAAARLLDADEKREAEKALREASAAANARPNSLSAALWVACGGGGGPFRTRPPPANGSLRAADIPLGSPYAKELRLLAHVLATAQPGDAASVCDAIERFGEDVLSAEGRWLKIAGRAKADVLKVSVEQAPDRGSILEIGTYCGFSALRMALAKPDTRIVTLEVDPAHMVIARNVVAFAGLAHCIDVWTGHSKDLLHRLPARYKEGPPLSFCAVFMDQRGSRYDEDLAILESLNLLRPGAVVIADNVLKPGSPFFLWRLFKSGSYDTQVVRLQEFAMPSEDWMSVSVRRPQAASSSADDSNEEIETVSVPEHPADLVQLQWESDRIRALATRPGQGVTYAQWSEFAEQMKEKFATFGIEATVDGADLEPLRQALKALRQAQSDGP